MSGEEKDAGNLVGVYHRNPTVRGQKLVSKNDKNKEKERSQASGGIDKIGDRLPK